jgi:acetyl-CoA synthetase
MFDRYLLTQSDRRCLIWVSNMVNTQKEWTFRQVYENVCRMSLILKKHGVVKGDRVIIYDPMIP